MLIKDRIYGNFEIKEPVLLELIKSKTFKRLKGISQGGLPKSHWPLPTYSRYEHSLGVVILLRRLGSSLEEQIAGLLHDISHTAFSHIGDIVLSDGYVNGVEDYHEKIKRKFLDNSDISGILQRFGFDIEILYDTDRFTLLEKHSPDLCADRVDYALREFKDFLSIKISKNLIDSLINFKNEIVFNDLEFAYFFSINFLKLQINIWGNEDLNRRYFLFADLLKAAFNKKIISPGDLIEISEEVIIKRMEKRGDKDMLKKLELLKLKDKLKLKKGMKIRKKFRYVDPKVIVDGKLRRLSDVKSDFKKVLEENKRINERGVVV